MAYLTPFRSYFTVAYQALVEGRLKHNARKAEYVVMHRVTENDLVRFSGLQRGAVACPLHQVFCTDAQERSYDHTATCTEHPNA